jgi:hypothetical protein
MFAIASSDTTPPIHVCIYYYILHINMYRYICIDINMFAIASSDTNPPIYMYIYITVYYILISIDIYA